MEKLISIVIPAYNAEKFIGECLKKILSQDYKNIEVIVSNDGSNDRTYDIAKEYQNKDSRVKIYSQENSGSSVARINGAKHANGEYILFLDSDDFFEDGAIKRLVEIAQKYNPNLVKFRLKTYPAQVPQAVILPNQDREEFIEKREFKDKIYPLFFNSYSLNPNSTIMVKKSCFNIDDVNAYYKLRFAEDLKLSLELFDKAKNVVVLTDVLYNYVSNPLSTTSSDSIDKILYNLDNFVKVYTKLYEYMEKWEINTKENIKKLDIKVLYEIGTFYYKICESSDKEYVNNKDRIKEIIYSDIVVKAMKNVSEKDYNSSDRFYNSILKVLKKEI